MLERSSARGEVVGMALVYMAVIVVSIIAGFMWMAQPIGDREYEYDSWTEQAWTKSFGRRAIFVIEHGQRGEPSRYVWEIWNTRDVDLDYAVVSEVTSKIVEGNQPYTSLAEAKGAALTEAYKRWGVVFKGYEAVREAS